MTIKKAIFPVGGLGTRFLPATKAMPKEMLPVVDKPLIQYAVEEASAAGVEQFIFVTGRNKTAIEDHFDHSTELESVLVEKNKTQALEVISRMLQEPGAVSYVRQQEPAGLGHAVWCARHLIGNEPVAVLLADDLILGAPALAEMTARYTSGNMVALMEVPASDTGAYGIITPGKKDGQVTEINAIVEKPSPETAPSTKAVVGRYILEPGVFDVLAKGQRGAGGEIQLTDALAARIGHVPFHGFDFSGERFDCGSKIGFLKANIAFGMARDELQGDLAEWLPTRL
ncbi:MAG: UTP--glucose-1-phosphate uridylyltransferase [Rhodospirillaceae bacterium]|jgi:UTP--glucose-1-phosphate uridylyltransferase|nr:UTP--glucose-1-phosphate uridylyltransferase GalU [Alphaproteobacteria bacterium]CAI8392931.1 MAG: UTP--glucose-1-phosphate uridylyltransferase [Rhodospirillaceae bacterium]